MEEEPLPLNFDAFKKYIWLALVLLIVILVGIAVNSSKETANQAAWTAFDNAEGAEELATVFDEHKESSASPWIGFALGNAYFSEGKYEKAGSVFREVYEMDRSYLTPYALQGCVDSLLSLGKKKEAQKCIDILKKDYEKSPATQLVSEG